MTSMLEGWTCSRCGIDTDPCACPDPTRLALEACVNRLSEVRGYLGPFEPQHRCMFDSLTETIIAAAPLMSPQERLKPTLRDEVLDQSQRVERIIEARIAVAVAAEREACAIAGAAAIRHSQQTTDQCRADVAAAIRARGVR